MKNKFFKFLCASIVAFSLASCGDTPGGNNGGNGGGNVILGENIYTKDDHDYSKDTMQPTTAVRMHYHRDDNIGDYVSYNPWEIWAWDATNGLGGAVYAFTHYDDFGVWADVPLAQVSDQELTEIGFLVCITATWKKDPDNDRKVTIAPQSPGGIQHIYLRSGEAKIFDDPSSALKSTIKSARIYSDTSVRVTFNSVTSDFKPQKGDFTLLIDGKEYTNFTLKDYKSSTKTAELILADEIDITKPFVVKFKFDKNWTDSVSLMITSYYDTDSFEQKYSYSGDDLGATFDNELAPTKTTFKVWAPTSSKMLLNIYNSGHEKETPRTIEMTKGQKGVWATTVQEDLDGKYYTYTVTNINGTNEVVDPYAKSAGLNGKRGMVVNFTKLNKTILGWSEDTRPEFGQAAVDASIYEMHVRDMTINPNSGVSYNNRGTFMGLTETGTTYTKNGVIVKTGLDHLEELGVTHVQILPFYDYNSVDEANVSKDLDEVNYNWGYDPLNYNVLEGSYSTNPSDGYNRIIEFKQMVMALHNKGININMDVVYNHTANTNNSNFNLLVPNYYYRTTSDGSFYNGSGCGNEVASDRSMGRKFVVDSVKFWLDEYHLAGYRFDLMGLLDNQTMIDVYDACTAIYDKAMVYGEPWTGGTSKLKDGSDPAKLSGQKTVQDSLAREYFSGNNKLVGAFNDVIRNAIRGDNGPGAGWIVGNGGDTSGILSGVQGRFTSSSSHAQNINPNQVLNYVSCHDNYTLHDQIILTNYTKNFDRAYSQAEAIVFTSQGVPFMQEGEDFLRSKNYMKDGKLAYEHNSYNKGDSINDMDYELKVDNLDMFKYFQALIAARKQLSDLTLSTRAEITSAFATLSFNSASVVAYRFNNTYVIHSVTGGQVTLPEGSYNVVLTNGSRTDTVLSGAVTLESNESLILSKI